MTSNSERVGFRKLIDRAHETRGKPLIDLLALGRMGLEQAEQLSRAKTILDGDEEVLATERAAVIENEAGMMQPNDLHLNRIPFALEELRLVVDASERAADEILKNAESMMAGEGADDGDFQATLENYGMLLVEACTFQDLLGQRVSKVVDSLEHIERRLNRFAKSTGVVDTKGAFSAEEALEEKRRDDLILHGPQDEADASSQDDIDALFA